MPTYPAYCPVGIDGHDYAITCDFLAGSCIERPNGNRVFLLCERHNCTGTKAERIINGVVVRGVVHDGTFTAAPWFGLIRQAA